MSIQLPLWSVRLLPITDQLHPGTAIAAKDDIHFSGDGSVILASTMGKVETSGPLACNVRFEGHPAIVLCLWNMLLVVDGQPTRKKKVRHLPKKPYMGEMSKE